MQGKGTISRRRLAAIVAGAVCAAAAPRGASADPSYWEGVVRDAAARHGVSPDWLADVAWCESRMDPHAVGQQNPDGSGPDTGLLQFSPATWREMTGYMGITADIWDGHAQAHVAGWCFASGYSCRWVCSGCYGS